MSAFEAVCGPGGPFEIHTEPVRGVDLPVFAHRARSATELLERAVAAHGDAGYLTLDGNTLDRQAFEVEVHAAAAGLSARGIGAGDRVALFGENSVEWIVSCFALWRLGATACAFNGWWTAPEAAHGLALTEPALLLADAKRLERLDPASLPCPVLDIEDDWPRLVADRSVPPPAAPVDEDDVALILFTSGTTGRPRAAEISHRGIVGFVDTHRANGTLRARATGAPPAPPSTPMVTLLTSPLFHVSGLLAGAVMNLVTGARVVLRQGRFDPLDVLALLERERVTHWSPLGSTGPRVARHPDLGRFDLSKLRHLGFGGGPVSPAIRAELQAAFPHAELSTGTGYGSTETVATVTSISGPEHDAHPASVGRPLPTVELAIWDDAGHPVAEGTAGRIVVRSPYAFLGYRSDPDATAAVLLPDGWLDTGDVGSIDDGRLTIDARARDLIIRSGENVSPIEVERRLDEHPAVLESAVVGRYHPEHGQEVAAVVVTDGTANADALAAHCRASLAAYKVPTQWHLTADPLPRNAAGKVQKGDLAS
ncbi:MAG: acyl--CoA ligase [Acidimicrobiales bacterium]|nr:acyl--CoA ligase [Acidimicrobiales bacterium]